MPDIVVRWLIILGIGVALFGAGLLKGCQHERDKWETMSAKAEAEAEKVTAERIRKQAEQVAQYEKEVKDANAANTRNLDLIRRLRDASSNLSRDSASPATSKDGGPLADELAACGERIVRHAKEADQYYSSGKLCELAYETIYNTQSIRSRKSKNP